MAGYEVSCVAGSLFTYNHSDIIVSYVVIGSGYGFVRYKIYVLPNDAARFEERLRNERDVTRWCRSK